MDAGAWYHEAVDYVLQNGLMGGYGSGLFGPDAPHHPGAAGRHALAVRQTVCASGGELRFHDAGMVEAHARDAMRWAVETGVMNGKGGDILAFVVRAQAAQILKNFLENG